MIYWTYSAFQAGTSRLFQYMEADYGKVADYTAAYENGSGKRGRGVQDSNGVTEGREKAGL